MNQGAAALMAMSMAWPLGAHAEPVYRCGSDGREYSSTQCPGGHQVHVGDRRSASQREAALAIAHDAQALALKLESARLQAEAAHRPATALSFRASPLPSAPPPENEPASEAKRHARHRVDRRFRALAPSAALPSKKTRKTNLTGSPGAAAKKHT